MPQHNIVIVGCGKAGFEHARVFKAHFSSRVRVVGVRDLDPRNEDAVKMILGDVFEPCESVHASGYVLDCRPYFVRIKDPINEIAKNYFDSYFLVEEKPATQKRSDDSLSVCRDIELSPYINLQRIRSPAWKLFKTEQRANHVVCIERNPAFTAADTKVIGDFLPHSCSFVFDLIASKLLNVKNLGQRQYLLEFEDQSTASVIFQRAAKPSCTVIVDYEGGVDTFHWPHGFSFYAADRVLPFFSIVASSKNTLRSLLGVLSSVKQYFQGPALYDDFRFSWNEILSIGTSVSYDQLDNQRLLAEKFFCSEMADGERAESDGRPSYYDLIIIGGSGYLGSLLTSELTGQTILIVSRRQPREKLASVKWVSLAEYRAMPEKFLGKKIIYMSSAMGADLPAHHLHNETLRDLLTSDFVLSPEVSLFVSSRTVFVRPGDPSSPKHSLKSALRRGAYSYGKLLDQNLYEEWCGKAPTNMVSPGVVSKRDSINYGLSFRIFSLVFIVGSRSACVPFADEEKLVKVLRNWVLDGDKLDDVNEYISLGDYYYHRYPGLKLIFIPKICARILCGILSPKYKKLRPLESLWQRVAHFYA